MSNIRRLRPISPVIEVLAEASKPVVQELQQALEGKIRLLINEGGGVQRVSAINAISLISLVAHAMYSEEVNLERLREREEAEGGWTSIDVSDDTEMSLHERFIDACERAWEMMPLIFGVTVAQAPEQTGGSDAD
jgi:hypothetical protein